MRKHPWFLFAVLVFAFVFIVAAIAASARRPVAEKVALKALTPLFSITSETSRPDWLATLVGEGRAGLFFPSRPTVVRDRNDLDKYDRMLVNDAALKHLGRLRSVQAVTIDYANFITDDGLAELVNLPNLRELSLCVADLTEAGFVHLGRMKRLESLYLLLIDVSGSRILHISNLRRLERLSLRYCTVTDSELEHLARLKELTQLDLSGADDISDVGLKHLKKLTKLEMLTVIGTSVTATGAADLKQALPNCALRFGRTQTPPSGSTVKPLF